MTTENTNSPVPTEGTKERLVQDLKGIVGKADHLLTDAGHTVAEEFSATRQAVTEKACGAADATQDYVRANPWKVVGIAAAAGLVIGALISRH